MSRQIPAIFAVALAVAFAFPAQAGSLTVTVSDGRGHTMRDAVVSLVPNEASRMPSAASVIGAAGNIDQRNEMFMPLVTVIPVGGTIVFTNDDHTMHHVYSFASIKHFEFVMNTGEKSMPVRFDKAGIAAIGCNIHDQMIAYVYVAESPWTGVTGADGTVKFDVPAGAYRTSLWHPELAPGREVPSTSVVMGNANSALTLTMPRLPVRARPQAHRGDY